MSNPSLMPEDHLEAVRREPVLRVGLEGWILESGQHPEIVDGQRISMAIELNFTTHKRIANPTEVEPVTGTTPLNQYQIWPKHVSDGPKIQIFQVFDTILAYTRTPEAGPIEVDGNSSEDRRVLLSIDPYFGRPAPEWMNVELRLNWKVREIHSRQRQTAPYRRVSSTKPHQASTSYILMVSPKT